MSQRLVDRIVGIVTTTDAVTVQTVCTYLLPSNVSANILYTLVGRDTGSGDSANGIHCARCVRVGGGAVVQADQVILAAAGSGTITAVGQSIVASTNNINLNVTGTAARTIEWMGILDIMLN